MTSEVVENVRGLLQLVKSLELFPLRDSVGQTSRFAETPSFVLAKEADTTKRIVCTLQDLLRRLSDHAVDIRVARNRIHNDGLPCNRLPNELLGAIFSTLTPDVNAPASENQAREMPGYLKSRSAIGAVCTRWTEILRSTPTCWSAFGNDLYMWDFYGDLWLKRSGGTPINLFLECRDSIITNQDMMESHFRFLEARMSQVRRCSVVLGGAVQLGPLMESLGRFPALRHLRVELRDPLDSDSDREEPSLYNAPRPAYSPALQSFCFWGIDNVCSISPDALGDLSLLTCLRTTVLSKASSISLAFEAVSRITSLVYLDLRVTLDPSHPPLVPHHVIFSRLKGLHLRADAVALFSPVTAPALEILGFVDVTVSNRAQCLEWIAHLARYPYLRRLVVPFLNQGVESIAALLNGSRSLVDVVIFYPLKTEQPAPLGRLLDLIHPMTETTDSGQLEPNPRTESPRIHIHLKPVGQTDGFEEVVAPALQRLIARSPGQVICIRPSSRYQEYFGEHITQYEGSVLLSRHIEDNWLVRPVFEASY